MRTSLWWKIELMVLTGTVVLCGVLGGLFLIEGRRDLDRQLDRRIHVIGDYLSEELAGTYALADEAALGRGLEAAVHNPEINYVIVQGRDGEVLASRATVLDHNAGLHEYDFPLGRSGAARPAGRLAIGVDLAPSEAEQARLVRRILWQVLLAMLFSAIATHGLVWTFIRRSRVLRGGTI